MSENKDEVTLFGIKMTEDDAQTSRHELQDRLSKITNAERKALTDPNYTKPLGATANSQLIERGEQ